ncbi:MAG: FTR1 family iron permease [Treponema sp.]
MTLAKKALLLRFVFITMFVVCASSIYSEQEKKKYSSWTEIVSDMEVHLNKAYEIYKTDPRVAYNEVNTAYFRFYESKGMEKITMAYLAGSRKTAVENAFYEYRKNVFSDKDDELIKQHKDYLIAMLYEDAKALDGAKNNESGKTPAVIAFISSFSLVLREGLEAILVIAAIIAYLIKTNKKKYVFAVYLGALGGVLASALLAFVFYMLKQNSGDVFGAMTQEVFEGIGMFLAVIVLFYVSNWMLSKSEAEAWEKYIKEKVATSVSTGNQIVLIFAAFIAVAREGAELILFFQGVQINSSAEKSAVVWAIVTSLVVLLAIFLAFRFLTVKLPLKPFFIVTSILMYIMCVSFTGKGVGELQEAGWIAKTPVAWMKGFEVDLLGLYATYESLIPQVIVLLLIIALAVYYQVKNKKELNARLKK